MSNRLRDFDAVEQSDTTVVSLPQHLLTHLFVGRRGVLYWALVISVVAIIAGALGFGGMAATSAGLAQILLFIFLAFLVISLLAGLFRRAQS